MLGEYQLDLSQLPPAPKGYAYQQAPDSPLPVLVKTQPSTSPFAALAVLGGAIAIVAYAWRSGARAPLPAQMNPFLKLRGLL